MWLRTSNNYGFTRQELTSSFKETGALPAIGGATERTLARSPPFHPDCISTTEDKTRQDFTSTSAEDGARLHDQQGVGCAGWLWTAVWAEVANPHRPRGGRITSEGAPELSTAARLDLKHHRKYVYYFYNSLLCD